MTHDTNSAPAPSDPLAEWEALAEEINWLLRWQDYPGRNRALRKSAEAIPELIGMVRERNGHIEKAWAAANEYRDNMFAHLDRATAAEERVRELRNALSSGSMTTESNGPSKHYMITIRFQSLEAMQQGSAALVAALGRQA